MTRINTNVSSLVAQNRLQAANKDLTTALTRLSTGLRINSGADDPAGLIASQALRSEITGFNKAISNTQRASQIITTADNALGQVSSLLSDVRGLVVEAANSGALSNEEVAANQLQIDSSLEAINRIAQTTTFQGRKLLDGSLGYDTTLDTVSSVQDSSISRAKVGSSDLNVEVVVNSAATQAAVSTGTTAFSLAANASTALPAVQTVTQAINGINVQITGTSDFTTIAFSDIVAGGTGTAAFDSGTNTLTITGNFTGAGTKAEADTIQAAINSIEGFVASGATAAGTAAAPTASTSFTTGAALTITADSEGADYNNVSVVFEEGTTTEASYDAEQKVITVTVDNTLGTDNVAAVDYSVIATAIEAGTDFTAVGLAAAELDITDGVDTISTGVTGGEVLNDDLVFQVSGSDGAETFNFGSGTSADQIASAINLVSDSTGVIASTTSGLTITSSGFGSDASVGVDIISEGTSGTFGTALTTRSDSGTDVDATVNGVKADGNGNTLSINTSSLALSLTLDSSGSNFSFDITGGGATFQLGASVSSTEQASIGIGSVSTGQLGGESGRLYELGSGQAKSLSNNVAGASDIIDEVISKITSLRGQLGAFQSTTLNSNITSLKETVTTLEEAVSSITDADFAVESARLTRAQILVQSGTNVLAIANQSPQNALALLR